MAVPPDVAHALMATPRLRGSFDRIGRSLLCCLLFASALPASEFTLVDAIREQNPKAINALVARSDAAAVNARQPDGSTPLAWAVYKDDAATVDLLLKAGAKATTADDYGETPLTLACANADAAIVEKLIGAGADANAARTYDETALMIAAGSGNPDIVRTLIAHGAKVDAIESRKGQTALMWAAAQSRSEVVAALLKAGANPNVASKVGFTPLVFAAEAGDTKSAASLIAAGADVNYEVPRVSNTLLIAITAKQPAVAGLLIDKGAAIDGKDRSGSTALHLAAQLGDLDMVKLLLKKGADVNARTNKVTGDRLGIFQRPPSGEQTPLMLAARANRPDIMRVLVEAGADPKLKMNDDSTLLMAAVSGGHLESVQYAYELDPSVKEVTDRKETVLHAAMIGTKMVSTEEEITKMVQFLVDKGAELDPMDINNRTPIALAKYIPLDSTVDLLTKLIVATGATPKPSKAR
jgi:ankyrin repeat protein